VIVIPLRIKVQLTAAIIATLLLPFPAEAVPRKVPYCSRLGDEQAIRQVDNFTIICRDFDLNRLNPDSKVIDRISLYRFNLNGLDLDSIESVDVYNSGQKLVLIFGNRNQAVPGSVYTDFWLQGRKFDRWASKANPDLLELRRSDVTLLLDTLENFPLKSSPPVRPSF